jgi:hypothetical protein
MRAISDIFVGLDGKLILPKLGGRLLCLCLGRSIGSVECGQWREEEGGEKGELVFHNIIFYF